MKARELYPEVVVILALASGCGFDAPMMDGPTEASKPPPAHESSQCDLDVARRELGPAGKVWMGSAPWTASELNTCFTDCPDATISCIESSCKDSTDFVECYVGELGYCAADDPESAPCAAAYARYGCCVLASDCTQAATDSEFTACIDEACSVQTAAFASCAERECAATARARCVSDMDSDAGAQEGPLPDASVGEMSAQHAETYSRDHFMSEHRTGARHHVFAEQAMRNLWDRGSR